MIDLKPKDFEKGSQNLCNKYSKKITLVKFYAPWCGFCKSSQPDFLKLDSYASDDFNIAQLDCQEYLELEKSLNSYSIYGYKVEGYPTMVIFVNSKFYDYYKGNRTYEDMLNTLTYIQHRLI